MPNPFLRLADAWDTKPTATTLPIGMISIGACALVLGDHASKAFDNFGGATLVRVLGFAMLVGGLIVVTGIVRADPSLEPIGLALATLGALIYGIGVIAGLHSQGLIAGQLALYAAVGFLGRIRLLVRAAPPPTRP